MERRPDRPGRRGRAALVGLDPAADAERFPNELTRPDRLRAAIARAIAATPPLLLLDSPFHELPPGQRARLQNELFRWPGRVLDGGAVRHA